MKSYLNYSGHTVLLFINLITSVWAEIKIEFTNLNKYLHKDYTVDIAKFGLQIKIKTQWEYDDFSSPLYFDYYLLHCV